MFLLLGGIVLYNYLTEDERVRVWLESRLSSTFGAPVKIEAASFSIFRGLDVKNVDVYVDDQHLPDSRLFHADQLLVRIDLEAARHFEGRLNRIEAQGVRVLLCEDPRTGQWNLQRLIKAQHLPAEIPTGKGTTTQVPHFPAILLSGARVVYARINDGILTTGGSLAIDAGIFPMPHGRYSFSVTTQAAGSDAMTTLTGMFDRRAGIILGRTSDLRFDHSLRNLLPSQVQDWCKEFALDGRFSIPQFQYNLADNDFDVHLAFAQVQANIQPRHWLSRQERARMELTRRTIDLLRRMDLNAPLKPGQLPFDPSADVMALDLLTYLSQQTQSLPITLDEMSGEVVFTSKQIKVNQVKCRVQGQVLVVDGQLNGYQADAAATLQIRTEEGTFLQIPPTRRFMVWMPDEIRKVYAQYQPKGFCTLEVKLNRSQAGADFNTTVTLDVTDTSFMFDDMPYPLYHCQGRLLFTQDPQTGHDILYLQDIHGVGVPGTPNEKASIHVNGVVGPFVNGGVGADVVVTGKSVHSDKYLRDAMPPEVRDALEIFGPLDYARRQLASGKRDVPLTPEEVIEWPHFFGNFSAHIVRPPGPGMHWKTEVLINVETAEGSLKDFPYPLRDVSMTLKVSDGLLELQNVKMHRGDATLRIDGTVKFSTPANPDLRVAAMHVPIDDDLLYALPPTERSWLLKTGLKGTVDITGRIFLNTPGGGRPPDLDFNLDIALHQGSFLQQGTAPAFTGLEGSLTLQPGRLKIHDMTGQRGEGSIKLNGALAWHNDPPEIQLNLTARNLLLDKGLHDVLPASVQEAWDQQQPEGTADIDLEYADILPSDNSTTHPATRGVESKLDLAIRPRKLTVTPKVFPYRMENLQGEILVKGTKVELKNLTARHEQAVIGLAGKGVTGATSDFKLKVSAEHLNLDKGLYDALPTVVADVLRDLQPSGEFAVKFEQLDVRTSLPDKQSAAPGTAPVDVDFNCLISTSKAGINIGVPVTEASGSTRLAGEVRASQMTKLDGTINLDSFRILGRDGAKLSAAIRRPPYKQELLIESLKSEFAGGTVAGGMTLRTPDEGASQYAVSLAIRNADTAQAAGQPLGKAIHAKASASLDVEGTIGDSASRRGRGDILVQGQGMYEAPIILGLFRVVNFALPVREGVNEVAMTYILSGERVTVDNIEMRAPGLRIYGNGVMDFTTRKLDFTLNTENPDRLKLPLLDVLVKRAREELLQIRVQGSLTQPAVSGETLPTFRATLDEVIESMKRNRD